MHDEHSISNLPDHVGYWLRYVSNHVSHAFARKVEAEGVTVAEWVLLREMLTAGAVNPSHLAELVGMTRGAVSKLVERLCLKELAIRTHSDTDRRFQTVELTTKGRNIVPLLAQIADENDQQFFGHLLKEEKTQLLETLRDIVRRHGWKEMPID
ncbi:MAG: MarR family winged helix-turn-helix transcriptional regulator [Zavarzinella sp.]